MDHAHDTRIADDGDDLERDAVLVVAEKDQAARASSTVRRWLVERQSAVLDDMTYLVILHTMFSC